MKKIGKFFTHRQTFWIFALTVLNLCYVSIEIYKSKFTQPLIGKSHITEAEFSKFETLSNYAYYFESAFLIVSIVWTLLMCSKKYQLSFKSGMIAQFTLLFVWYVVNSILSVLFKAPIGNLTQLLWLPIVFAVVGVVYFVLSNLISKLRRNDAML
ncbi:hypothetical protein JNUCC1_02828 [Lentibacillus sp. JNUCC-1]|uniref:hypothetical protein n=1 Tax=Lentibacillus sp. JNUCC-1 TaxID=2654513 RepID=UPI0012E76003|nr:hypothetical protein [Lentibacillus sp. JNUCC-1]MUV38956.1 hypothetical protein [Lentibacillus sp. JNUCC-1]